MAGLLDFISSPAGVGLLSAVAGGMAGARRGTPINNIGRGLVTGVGGYQGAQQQIRADEENALTKQLRQMQMQKLESDMANQKGMRESLQSLYKPAGTAPYQADNPFGEDLGDLKTETPATFGGKPVDPVMAAVLPYAQPDDILKMASPQSQTAEQKNWQFAQGLPEDQRAAFLGSNNASPANVQEWQFFSKLDPQAQAQFLEMKRNPQIMNLGGSQAVRAPGGGISENYAVTPKITETPDYQAAQESAKASAKAAVEGGVESTKKGKTADALLSNIDQAEAILKTGKPSGSLLGAGVSAAKRAVGMADDTTSANQQLKLIGGWMVSNVPRMEGPQSNFDVQNYREMAATVGDETIPVKDRLSALQQLRVLQNKYKQVQQAEAPNRGGVLNRGEILNVELEDAIARGDNQNANLIRQEMSRMGMKAPGATKPAVNQSAGTFKDPIRVTNDADYNSVPKGKYYQAPDGSIRIRK